MTTDRRTVLGGGASLMLFGLFGASCGNAKPAKAFPFRLSDAEWKKRLSPAAYTVMRKHGTERAGTSPLDREKRAGLFVCASGCGQKLYSSKTKFDSGTGWPSFWKPLPGAVGTTVDKSMFIARTEIHCARCGSHLGHVFNDGPKPTGLRYCMNGVALKFVPGRAA